MITLKDRVSAYVDEVLFISASKIVDNTGFVEVCEIGDIFREFELRTGFSDS